MGWGISLGAEIYYSKVSYKSKEEVEERIKSINETIEWIKASILKYVYMTEPEKLLPKEYRDNPMSFLEVEVTGSLEDMDDLIHERAMLFILAENWDKAHHKENGLAIVPYNPNETNRVWMYGNFVKSCTPDGKEVSDDYWDKYKYDSNGYTIESSNTDS